MSAENSELCCTIGVMYSKVITLFICFAAVTLASGELQIIQIVLNTFKIMNGQTPVYLSDLVQSTGQ